MRSTTQRSFVSISSILLLFGILILGNALARSFFRNASVDLTQEGEYTLSDGTENILEGLTEPITLKYYYSKSAGARYPIVRLWGERIGDLLREYERISRGKIVVETYDPRPDSEEEEWAQKYGLAGLPTRDGETVYIGVAGINAQGNEQVLPVLDLQRQQYLEYDLSRLIVGLSREKRPVIGVLSSLPVLGTAGSATQPETDPWTFVSQLREYGEVREIPTASEEIPAEIEFLLVAHPKGFASNQWYAIDQFVMRGGRLLMFTDPYCSVDVPANDPQNPMASISSSRSSDATPLISAWGVSQQEGRVVADRQFATTVATARGEEPKPHPLWLSVGSEAASRTDVVTSQLESVLLPWPGTFEIKAKEGVSYEPLLHSSTESELVGENDYRFGGGDPDILFRKITGDKTEYPLAIRIRGRLPSAFPNGRPPELPPVSTAHLPESKGAANVILVADSDMLADRFSVTVQDIFGARVASLLNDNLNFVLNSVENLSGSEDLIAVRSRGRFTRPFTVVENLEKGARTEAQREEMRLQAMLNTANQRLQQLQAGSGKGDGSVVLSKDLMDEIRKFREQKSEIQRNLRVVRRELRQGIENLGQILFFASTFAVPIVLVVGYILYLRRSKSRARAKNSN